MAPAGSDSENEDEVERAERTGDEVDPAIAQAEHEEEGGDEEDEDDDDDDDDDDEVPEPNGAASAQLGASKAVAPAAAAAATSSAPKPSKTLAPAAKTQTKLAVKPVNKLPSKPLAKPTSRPPAAASAGAEADDDEGEEQMTFSIAQRQLPNFAAYDAAADAESMRKRQTDAGSAIAGAHIEPYINPELADEAIIHKDLRVNKYIVGPPDQRGHQRGNDPFKITHAAFTSKNPRAKPAGWTERLIDREGTKVLANLCITRVPWAGDAEGDISVIGSVKVELYKDETVQEKQYNDFTRKMPSTDKAGIYMQFDERQMRRLYDITDCGLPTMYHPNNPNVHYRVIVKAEDYAATESGWTLYVAPPKQRPSSSGTRKAAADKADGGGAAKKQKTTVQTSLTTAPPPPATEASMSSAIVVAQEPPPPQHAPPENGVANGIDDYSDGAAPVPAQPQPQPQPAQPAPAQPHALVPMAQPVAVNGTVAVQPLAARLPLVHWTNNGGGVLTAMLPDAYTYALHAGPGGTLLIANLAPTL